MQKHHRAAWRAVLAAMVATAALVFAPGAAAAAGTLVAAPDEIDFGTLDHGTAVTETVTIRNDGPDPVTISEIGLGETEVAGLEDEWAFDLVGGDCFEGATLAAGAHCALEVEFAPYAGLHEGMLAVWGGPDDEPAAVALVGGGRAPWSPPLLSASPSSLDFGTAIAAHVVSAPAPVIPVPTSPFDGRSKSGHTLARAVTIQNVGADGAHLGSPAATPPFAAAASRRRCGGWLAAGATCQIIVSVDRGREPGGYHGTLTVPVTGAKPLTIPLSLRLVAFQPLSPPAGRRPLAEARISAALKRTLAPVARLVRGGPRRTLRLPRFAVREQGILRLRVRARIKKRWVTIATDVSTVGDRHGVRIPFQLNRAGLRVLAGRRPVRIESRLRFHAIDRDGVVTEIVRGTAKPKQAKPRKKAKRRAKPTRR